MVGEDRYLLFEWDASRLAAPPDLTLAERDVLTGVLQGETNAAIAARRGTRTRTVANQLAALYRKLGVRSRTELIARMTHAGP